MPKMLLAAGPTMLTRMMASFTCVAEMPDALPGGDTHPCAPVPVAAGAPATVEVPLAAGVAPTGVAPAVAAMVVVAPPAASVFGVGVAAAGPPPVADACVAFRPC